MAKNLCRCTICKSIGTMILIGHEYDLPYRWKETEVGDLCPPCAKLWEQAKEDFRKTYQKKAA